MQKGGMRYLEQEIYQLISQSFIRLDSCDQQLMQRFGLTLNQSWALVHLADPQGRSLSELAHLLICDKSNVTSIVDRLEELDLAERKRGKAGDRRYTRVVLTEKGQQLRTAVISAREHMVHARLNALNDNDLDQLQRSLRKFADILVAQFENNQEDRIIEEAFEQSHAGALSNNNAH